MRLDKFARDLTYHGLDDDKSIDFGAAGLYLPAAQTIFATTLSACVSVLACWLIPIGAISAVRTLALTVISGVLVIRRPIRIGQTRGVNTIFSALRPCCVLYVCCLVLEQLIHTCISNESTYEHGFWRRILYHGSMTTMTLAGFLRSKNPRGESDVPFVISVCSMLIIAALPPPALALSGPLCSPPTLGQAGERVLRAFMFSCVYVVLVYSAAPISNNLADTLVCIMRSATSSAWVLGAVSYSLPLALVQVCMVLYCSFSPANAQYDAVAPIGVSDDMEASGMEHGVGLAGSIGQAPSIDVRCVTPEIEDKEIADAVAIIRGNGMSNGPRPMSVQPVAGNLSFNLSGVSAGLARIPSADGSAFREGS